MAKLTEQIESNLNENSLRKDIKYRTKAEKKGGVWLEYQATKPGPYGKGTWLPVKHFSSKELAQQYLKDNKEK